MERTDVSNFGFGRRPERRTIISNDHISKLLTIIMVKKFGNRIRISKRIERQG